MSRALITLFCLVAVGCEAGKNAAPIEFHPEPITLEVTHSLRIPARRVTIHLEADRRMTVEVQDRNQEARSSTRLLEGSEMESVQALARRVDWRQVARDEVLGSDGASVRIRYREEDHSVWSPEADTRERKLGDLLDLIEELFRLGGLTESGLPR